MITTHGPMPAVAPITADALNSLTIQEILHVTSFGTPKLQIPSQIRRGGKANLISHVLQNGSHSVLIALRRHLDSKSVQQSRLPAKRARHEESFTKSRKASCNYPDSRDDGTAGQFMEIITPSERRQCHLKFYNATSNAAVKPVVCGVCARENDLDEHPGSIRRIPLGSIPNSDRLKPHTPHQCHTLYDGKLLDKAGIDHTPNGDILVTICAECWRELEGKINLPPKFSLANDMWIGEIPLKLQGLSLPEQLLLAQLYPRVYVFKLFPKKIQGKRDVTTLQSALRGNVTTFELDNAGIASMIDGNLMPRPPAILASVITVTFCGLGELPKSWLHNTFRVRRHVVRDALKCLKEISPKYYGEIDISEERLGALPENDVPPEILSIIRQTEDSGIVDEEGASSYVPTSEDCKLFGTLLV